MRNIVTRVRKLFFVDLQETYFNDSYAMKSYYNFLKEKIKMFHLVTFRSQTRKEGEFWES